MPISYNLEVTNGRLDRYKIDSKYKNDRNLIVYGVHSDDAGTYQCRLTKSGSSPVVRPVVLIVNGMYSMKVVSNFLSVFFSVARWWYLTVSLRYYNLRCFQKVTKIQLV